MKANRSKERSRHQIRMETDPDYRARKQASWRRSQAKRLLDPDVREKARERSSEWNQKMRSDPDYLRAELAANVARRQESGLTKISSNIRCRLYQAVTRAKAQKISGSFEQIVGCSWPEFKVYFENLFEPGMTWSNHSLKGWHVDHIIPVSSFDLTDPDEQRKANHWSNLQPLWAFDNLSKSNKI